MKQRIVLLGLLLFLVVSVGCAPEEKKEEMRYDRPLRPGERALRKITDPYQIPDFTIACLDLEDLQKAIERSRHYLSKPSSKQFFPVSGITHSRTVRSLEVLSNLLESGLSGGALNQEIRRKFDVYMSVGCDNKGTVLFTGYYTPIFEGSWEGAGQFQYPLYKEPSDLVKDSFGEILGRRIPDGYVAPYPARSVIESMNMLAGSELIWLKDAFKAYVAQVQGSAKVRLPDGDLVTVGYAANNGHEYKSIGNELVRDGRIPSEQLSLTSMMDYFRKHPEDIPVYTNRNPRYVFFKRYDGEPHGSLNEPVTGMRTIATDKLIFPRGALTFVSAELPRLRGDVVVSEIYSGFALDQDTGGAIRAPGRCDFYMGVGDSAGDLAGRTRKEGKLYYLFVKEKTSSFDY
ncbi:MltA domain-containing protein [Planctomycetota bacterium]